MLSCESVRAFRRAGTLVGKPDVAESVSSGKAICDCRCKVYPADGRESTLAPAPVRVPFTFIRSFSVPSAPRFILCDCCERPPLPFSRALYQPSTDPLRSFAHDRISNRNNSSAKPNRPRTPNRVAPNSAAVPRISHSQSGPLATVAAAVASIVLCYLLAIPPASAAQSADLPTCCQNPHQQSLASSFQRQPRTSPAPTHLQPQAKSDHTGFTRLHALTCIVASSTRQHSTARTHALLYRLPCLVLVGSAAPSPHSAVVALARTR
ncbi:hypothetical protein Q7P35_009621 [Cladosporium inversicolor]